MSFMISRPLTAEQRKFLENKTKPSVEDIRQASDDLFMYLLNKVAELEAKETPKIKLSTKAKAGTKAKVTDPEAKGVGK